MNTRERRRLRIDSRNLVSYTLLDDDGKPIKQGIGRTLDVSENGIRLEAYSPLDPRNVLLLTIGLENDLMEFRGKIVYTKPAQGNRCEHGIQFIDLDEKRSSFLRQYIVMVHNPRRK